MSEGLGSDTSLDASGDMGLTGTGGQRAFPGTLRPKKDKGGAELHSGRLWSIHQGSVG